MAASKTGSTPVHRRGFPDVRHLRTQGRFGLCVPYICRGPCRAQRAARHRGNGPDRPPLSAFAARIGQDKFAEIAEAVNKAAHARQMSAAAERPPWPNPIKAPDPKALEVKYTYPDAAKDDAAIKKVETAIAATTSWGSATGLAQKSDNAPDSRRKSTKSRQRRRARRKPRSVCSTRTTSRKRKKRTGRRRPDGHGGKAVATVREPPKAGADPRAPKGGKGEGAKPPQNGRKPHGPPGAAPSLKPPRELALAAASSSDGDSTSGSTTTRTSRRRRRERLSKITEMSGDREELRRTGREVRRRTATVRWRAPRRDDQLPRQEGDGRGSSARTRTTSVQGGLASFMRFLSAFQNVVSIVGNICAKVGMVLTVLGLIRHHPRADRCGRIAVARVLNVVGIVCDALGFALSGILAGPQRRGAREADRQGRVERGEGGDRRHDDDRGELRRRARA